MHSNGHTDLTATSVVVHTEKCWLGASPDAWFTDPSVDISNRIAEFKCPYMKADTTPE